MENSRVYLLVALSAFFWGANFVLAGPVLVDVPPVWAAAFRFLLAAGLMLIIAMARREALFDLARRHAGTYLMLGLVGIAAFNLLFFTALRTTSASNGALIMATNPLLTALLAAPLLGERPGARHLAALPVALAGVAVVIAHGDLSRLLGWKITAGDGLMLAANLAWALYNVFSRRYMPAASSVANTALIMMAGAAILMAAALGGDVIVAMPGAKATLALVAMVAGGTVLAYLFWGIGIRHLGAGRTAIFLNLVPVFAMLIGAGLGTAPTPAQLVGGMLVLGAVSLTMLPSRRLAPA